MSWVGWILCFWTRVTTWVGWILGVHGLEGQGLEGQGLRVRVCLCIEVHKWGWRCRLINLGATIQIILEVLGSIQGLVGM